MASDKGEMSFLDHLEELRWRIIKSAIAVVVCTIPCAIFWRLIFDALMVHPLSMAQPRPHLIYTAPAEAVMLSMKVAIFGGLVLSAPFVFYQLWRFVAPGLYPRERHLVLPTVIASTGLFLLGIAFCYELLPYVVSFLTRFGAGSMEAMFRTKEYLGFLIRSLLAFGIVFQLPVISFALTKLGLLTPRFLIHNIRYAIVIIFILAALMSSPDVISQCIMAIPLLALYGVSILVSYIAIRKKSE